MKLTSMPGGLAIKAGHMHTHASGPAHTTSVTVDVLSGRAGFLLIQAKVVAAGQGLEVGISGLFIQAAPTPPSFTHPGPQSAGARVQVGCRATAGILHKTRCDTKGAMQAAQLPFLWWSMLTLASGMQLLRRWAKRAVLRKPVILSLSATRASKSQPQALASAPTTGAAVSSSAAFMSSLASMNHQMLNATPAIASSCTHCRPVPQD